MVHVVMDDQLIRVGDEASWCMLFTDDIMEMNREETENKHNHVRNMWRTEGWMLVEREKCHGVDGQEGDVHLGIVESGNKEGRRVQISQVWSAGQWGNRRRWHPQNSEAD